MAQDKIDINASDEFLKKLYEGDSRCKYPVGNKIIKSSAEDNDHHKVGDKGIITGSYHIPDDSEFGPTDFYIVTFEGDELPTLIMGEKLELDDTV